MFVFVCRYDVFEYGGYCPVSIVEDQVVRRGLPECGVCVLEATYSSKQRQQEEEKGEGAAKEPADRWFAFASRKYVVGKATHTQLSLLSPPVPFFPVPLSW